MNKLKPKMIHKVGILLCVIGAALGFVGITIEVFALMIVGVVILLSSILFRWVCYRCPHCGKYLDRSTGDFCPYCGNDVNK